MSTICEQIFPEMYPKHMTQCEISLINLEPRFPRGITQYMIWHINVIKIEEEFKFVSFSQTLHNKIVEFVLAQP